MPTYEISRMKSGAAAGVVCAAVALLALSASAPAAAQDYRITEDTLLDRIRIEDMLARYYFDLATGDGHAMSEYYADGAVLDVNGTVATGHEEIRQLYGAGGEDSEDAGSDDADSAASSSRAHMLLTNPIIEVDGNTATAWVIWTGVMNDDIKAPPRLFEQGREYSELVKQDGRWLIEKRYISADSGMPDRWDATYEPRTHR